MIEYEIKNPVYQGKIFGIPNEKEEIKGLLPNIFGLHKFLLMTRGISEDLDIHHPHVEKIKNKLSSIMQMNDDNSFSILSQIKNLHQIYSQITIEDSFKYGLLENQLFFYPDTNSIETKFGNIEQLTIRDEYWLIRFPLYEIKLPSFVPDIKQEVEFNIHPSVHEHAIAFIHELEKREQEFGGELESILDNLILSITENINDYF